MLVLIQMVTNQPSCAEYSQWILKLFFFPIPPVFLDVIPDWLKSLPYRFLLSPLSLNLSPFSLSPSAQSFLPICPSENARGLLFPFSLHPVL